MSDPATNPESAEALQRRGQLAFSWNDLDSIELPSDIVTRMFRVGTAEDAPTVFDV